MDSPLPRRESEIETCIEPLTLKRTGAHSSGRHHVKHPMKYALTFIAGVAVGIVCLYAWQGYQFQRITMGASISQISSDDLTERKSFDVTYGRALRVVDIGSGAIFTLTLNRLPNGNVGYAWKSDADDQNGGRGKLFEKYEEVAKTPTGTHVKDAGGSLRINLSGHSLEWSSGSESSGYIYYNPSNVALAYQTKD